MRSVCPPKAEGQPCPQPTDVGRLALRVLRTVRADFGGVRCAATAGSVFTGDEIRMNRLGAVSVRRYASEDWADDWLGLKPSEFVWLSHAGRDEQLRLLVAAGDLPGLEVNVGVDHGAPRPWTAPDWLAAALDLDDGKVVTREHVEAAMRQFVPRRDESDAVHRIAVALKMGCPATVSVDRVVEEAAGLTRALSMARTEQAALLVRLDDAEWRRWRAERSAP